jgi:hypothetical protein
MTNVPMTPKMTEPMMMADTLNWSVAANGRMRISTGANWKFEKST